MSEPSAAPATSRAAMLSRRRTDGGAGTAAQSLRDAAYEAIKHRIITCVFKPGEAVNEGYVSSVLGVGRTPVHQALDRLRLEGMVDVIPRKGVIVRPVNLDEVMNIIEVRLLNETQCARLAAERAAASDLAALAGILGRAREWTAARDVEQMMLLDRDFHLALARAAKNPVLADILSKLHERSLRFWFLSLTTPEHHGPVQDQHDAIFAAIRRRDSDAAAAAMSGHIESFRQNLARQL